MDEKAGVVWPELRNVIYKCNFRNNNVLQWEEFMSLA